MPEVDPAQHRLMIHGLVKRPLLLSMDDIMRFPSVSRIHFIECGANTGMEWGNVAVPTVQYSHGMLACSEFTGVLLSTLLDEVGYDKKTARFVLAEGADGSALTRTIPMEFALNDVMVVYGQNGEMLRPENGYPLRLLVPGVQGVSSVKWLRRLEVGDKPWNAREESLHYIDLMPDGTHRQYSGVQEVKSVITTPSGGQMLQGKGYYEITGLAWSGRGKIKRVDVSTDGGRNWQQARLQDPVLSKALTRFRIGLELGRQPRAAAEPGGRRDRPRSADDRPAARGARHAFDLSQQRSPDLEREAQRRGVECPDRLGRCCPSSLRRRWSRWPARPSRRASPPRTVRGSGSVAPPRRRRSRAGTSTCGRTATACARARARSRRARTCTTRSARAATARSARAIATWRSPAA